MKKCPFFKSICLGDECGWWSKAVVRDEQPGILGFEEGCAIALLARTGGQGYIPAGKLAKTRGGFFSEESLHYMMKG